MNTEEQPLPADLPTSLTLGELRTTLKAFGWELYIKPAPPKPELVPFGFATQIGGVIK